MISLFLYSICTSFELLNFSKTLEKSLWISNLPLNTWVFLKMINQCLKQSSLAFRIKRNTFILFAYLFISSFVKTHLLLYLNSISRENVLSATPLRILNR